MPRRIKRCDLCRRQFIVTTSSRNEGEDSCCALCRQAPNDGRARHAAVESTPAAVPTPTNLGTAHNDATCVFADARSQQQQRADASSNNASRAVSFGSETVQNVHVENGGEEEVEEEVEDMDDDEVEEEGSEAGDEVLCTQIAPDEEEEEEEDDIVDCSSSSDDDEEGDDESLALTELVAKNNKKRRMSSFLESTSIQPLPRAVARADLSENLEKTEAEDTDSAVFQNDVVIDLQDSDQDEENRDSDTKNNVEEDEAELNARMISSVLTQRDDENDDQEEIVVVDDNDEAKTPASTTGDTGNSPQPVVVLQGSNSAASATNETLETCSICGQSLAHILTWKGRVNHVKRCSKHNGVSLHEMRERMEEDAEYNRKSISPQQALNNPYHAKSHRTSPNSANRSSVTPTTTKGPSAFDMLMVGAKKAAQDSRWKRDRKQSKGKSRTSTGAEDVSPSAAAFKENDDDNDRNNNNNFEGGRKRQRHSNSAPPNTASVRPCPAYKKISGTDFVVDGFHFANPTLTNNYFLTHFHSDHYGGITKHWNAGIIYCSQATANLVHTQLGVDWSFLHVLPMNQPTALKTGRGNTVTVTLLDANHCPGAVMMLFQVAKRFHLHVGDFRWNRDIMLNPRPNNNNPLRSFSLGEMQLDELYLDTTYCDPKHDLPSQQDAIQATVEFAVKQVKEARSFKQKILLLFGAYTIGKERIYLAVAERLRMKVYVDKRRYRILSQFGWSQEQMAMLTTQPQDSILWVVPLGHVGMKKLPAYETVQIGKSFSQTFDRVIGFRPTGWSMTKKRPKYKDGSRGSLIKVTTKGKITSCGVPYSEHSSFPELVDCIDKLKPKKIIPTVAVSKSKQQVELLLSHLAK